MEKKYVWLNIQTGQFSNSWSAEEHQKHFDDAYTEKAKEILKKDGYKIIEYTCINDETFEFYNRMKIN